jgi:amino acid adenylation domain-containing protein
MNGSAQPALHARFLRGLALAPDRPALRLETGEVSYRQMHRLALEWAGSLLAASPEPPRAVGVLAGKGLEAYAGLLAGLYLGAAVVPLHPGFPEERTRGMLVGAGVSALIADRAGLAVWAGSAGHRPDVPVLAPGCPTAEGTVRVDPGAALAAPLPVAGSDLAYVLFTSGSTGRPKGVPITHGSCRHYFDLLDRRYDFTAEDVFSQTFDLNFDCAMFDLFCAWGAGATVQPVPAHAYRDLPRFLAERRVTVWFSTPSAISLVRRTGGLAAGSMPALRWSLFAGEALRCTDAVDWLAAADRSTLENIYGPTELTVTITGHRWDPATTPELAVNGLVPIGGVHAGHDHLLLAEDGGLAEQEGELCVSGPQMTAGYLDPGQNAGRFLEHGGRTWYRTGDRVRRIGDGELAYLGRLDSQVQVQGWRVELAEVEHALRSCIGVREAVTVARPTDSGSVELVVFYTGDPTPPSELARRLRTVLPQGMLPRLYRHLDELPLNSNRKIDRAGLAQQAAEAEQPRRAPASTH